MFNQYGYGCEQFAGAGYSYGVQPTPRLGGFALIVVLFILLIIVGSVWS